MNALAGLAGLLPGAHSERRSVDAAALVLRCVLGVVFVAHGGQKLFGWFGGPHIAGTARSFHSAGIPAAHVFAYVVGLTELLGGLMCLLGLFTVLAAVAHTIEMVFAIALVTHKAGFFVTSKPGWELNLDLIAMAVALAIMGAGSWSLDRLLGLTRRPAVGTEHSVATPSEPVVHSSS